MVEPGGRDLIIYDMKPNILEEIMFLRKIKLKILKVLRGWVSVEELRKRGAIIGYDVQLWTSKIDKNHGYLLEIGNHVTISDARILLHDASTKRSLGYSKIGKVKIGNNVFIGADAIILPGVHIGDNVIVGAGTIVTRTIPSNAVVVGNPGRVIGTYHDYINKNRELLSNLPVYDIYWVTMTDKQRQDISNGIGDGYGFEL